LETKETCSMIYGEKIMSSISIEIVVQIRV